MYEVFIQSVWYSGAKICTIYERTNEIQNLVILNSILGKYKKRI